MNTTSPAEWSVSNAMPQETPSKFQVFIQFWVSMPYPIINLINR
jgi:hypothetical protein